MQYLIHFLQKHCLWLRQESSFESLPGADPAVFLLSPGECVLIPGGCYNALRPSRSLCETIAFRYRVLSTQRMGYQLASRDKKPLARNNDLCYIQYSGGRPI